MLLKGPDYINGLKGENRLLKESTGDNTDFTLNFVPKMNPDTLINGYRDILSTIYTPRELLCQNKDSFERI